MRQPSFTPIRRIYTGDNLPILRSMDSESVDLIYLDPPFNSKRWYENPIQAGGKKAIAAFKDTWALSDIHVDYGWQLERDCPDALDLIQLLGAINGDSWTAYLTFMGVRLLEMRRILRPTGSIYYHCDPVMSHGVKLVMDSIFGGDSDSTAGKGNFKNELMWHYAKIGVAHNKWTANTDHILFYTKSSSYSFEYQVLDEPNEIFNRFEKLVRNNKLFYGDIKRRRDSITKSKIKVAEKAIGRPLEDSDVVIDFNDKRNKKRMDNVWKIPFLKGNALENTGYPTQKPLALLSRIIAASSNKGDLVLDPFCGCATTCLAAEILGRSWIGIDLSEQAAALVIDRLKKRGIPDGLDLVNDIQHLTALPKRKDLVRTDDQILRPQKYDRQRGRCEGCGVEFPLRNLENDHVIARSDGGQDEDVNIQLLCGTCNRIKGNRGMEYLDKYLDKEKMQEEGEQRRQERRDAAVQARQNPIYATAKKGRK